MDRETEHLVIFDCDGVLVDSEVIAIAVDQIVLADLGWSLSLDEIIDRFVGGSHAYFVNVVEEHLDRKLPDDWEDAYQHLYREALRAICDWSTELSMLWRKSIFLRVWPPTGATAKWNSL